MKTIVLSTGVPLAVLLSGHAVNAATYYVDATAGDDAFDGLQPSQKRLA